jgi:hypothetical protein
VIKENLIITGNGFDLYHGIDSTYRNFKSYLAQGENEALLQCLDKYVDENASWQQFEDALGRMDAHREEHPFTREMGEKLRGWAQGLDTCKEQRFSRKVISNKGHFLNFNYTNTLENTYKINPERILYIHGIAAAKGKLIVGHGNRYIRSDRVFPQFLPEARGRVYKNPERIIERHRDFFFHLEYVNRVYVMGHSLEESDLLYFGMINRMIGSRASWRICSHTEEERGAVFGGLLRAGVRLEQLEMYKIL